MGASLRIEKQQELLQLFVPFPSAITFGFLGAYFFSLTDVLRRYARGDLKPKAYSSISVRVLVVIILAWVLDRIVVPANNGAVTSWFGGVKLAFIFLVGIFPETGLTYIREIVRAQFGKLIAIPQEQNPLTDLDGVDLYDRTRLLDEGVTNIESLAHHDFIDLMMETRIPVARLVDWVDQAILYLHVSLSGQGVPGSHSGLMLAAGLRELVLRMPWCLAISFRVGRLSVTVWKQKPNSRGRGRLACKGKRRTGLCETRRLSVRKCHLSSGSLIQCKMSLKGR